MMPAVADRERKVPGFWATVWLLLRTSRQRSTGRKRRQQELLKQRSGQYGSTDWSALGTFFPVMLMMGLHVAAAFVLHNVVEPPEAKTQARTIPSEKIAVSQQFMNAVNRALNSQANFFTPAESAVPQKVYAEESQRIAERTGLKPNDVEQSLRDGLHDAGAKAFVVDDAFQPKPPPEVPASVRLAPMLGSIVLLFWASMLVFQGEGLEMDLQRRRHPMWEWLLSHPVAPGAVFLAESLSPLAANPIYWGAPIFVGFVYGFTYGPALGALATLLAGVPLAAATGCLGKALEIAVMLRVAPRSRGAVIGLMSWFGYTSMMLLFFALFLFPKLIAATTKFLLLFTMLPWPYLRWFLGGGTDGSYNFTLGIVTCWLLAGMITTTAVWFSIWGAWQGLAGNFAADSRPASSRRTSVNFGKEPLYRKELLWFRRDRSAIVQSILIPITVAGFQLFNLRGLLRDAQGAWNYICGAAILFGTYFLWVLGPKSLASEGAALWIAQTWPRGLESLLKAKAWLWSLLSSAIVGLVLCYASLLFPKEMWKIALVGVGWFIFGRSMAEKSVTLVTVQSESGEVTKVPRGRQWATMLGMLTFSIGILTQQWHIAVMGIVYSWITAAAIWQNFRARLPFLYDPWSETLPEPPTLMHAMVAISLLVEGGAVVTGILLPFVGRENIAIAQAIGYAVCSAVVAFGTANFLEGRGVEVSAVLNWRGDRVTSHSAKEVKVWRGLVSLESGMIQNLLAGVTGGLALGIFAHGYLALLHHIPATAEILHKSEQEMAKIFALKQSYFVMAVFFAPFAEEYLFRGLLYRALDREWGGWKAVFGSAAFFAIYHNPLSWLPVGLLGIANAVLFKKTGRLAPSILLHMVYNAVVLG